MHALTNLELHYVLLELQRLVGSHVEQIYGIEQGRFRFRFRGSAGGDVILDLPRKLLYFTKRLEKGEGMPDDFVAGLRRRLENAKVESIEQHKFDRVAVMRLRAKDEQFVLVIELFSNGNLILCDAEMVVLQCFRVEEWKDRAVKLRQKYIFPHSLLADPAKVDDKKLAAMVGERHIIATLARTVPIGTAYLEEALAQCDIEPTAVGKAVETKRLKALAAIVRNMCTVPKFILYEPRDAAPDYACYILSDFENAKATEFSSISECIDENLARMPVAVAEDEKLVKEREALRHSIEEQKTALEGFEKAEQEARAAGEAIYNNYGTVEAALKEAKEKGKVKTEIEL